jgi:hypothetical protein
MCKPTWQPLCNSIIHTYDTLMAAKGNYHDDLLRARARPDASALHGPLPQLL